MQNPSNTPRENSSTSREDVIANARQMFETMRGKIDDQQRQRILQLIQSEKLTPEALTAADTILDSIQREYAQNPTKSIQILNAMIQVGNDGELSRAEITRMVGAGSQGPESMQKVGTMVEKMSTMMNGLGDQLGTMGSGTLKMLEGFFGPDSLFGKVFAMLKNTPKAQIAYIEKKLLGEQKTLSPNTDPQQILNVLKGQITKGLNAERRAKRVPTYDIVQHVEQLMAEIDSTKTELTLADFQSAGEKVIASYETEVALLPPPAVAAQETQRAQKDVNPSAETAIAQNDATPLKVTRHAEGVSFTIVNKTAVLKKVGEGGITSVVILDSTATKPAAVVLTLADNAKVQIEATELKSAASDTKKKTIVAKNLTTGSDLSLEIQFA